MSCFITSGSPKIDSDTSEGHRRCIPRTKFELNLNIKTLAWPTYVAGTIGWHALGMMDQLKQLPSQLVLLSQEKTKHQPHKFRQRAELSPTISKVQAIKLSGAFPISPPGQRHSVALEGKGKAEGFHLLHKLCQVLKAQQH